MRKRIQVVGVLSAEDVRRKIVEGGVTVVVDVLRCTTTMAAALANGAEAVVPVSTIEEAMKYREVPGCVLAGERGGVKPEGFHLGNSPLEFTEDRVRGKTVILTTTNGTKAVMMAKECSLEVIAGSIVNASSVATEACKLAEKLNLKLYVLAVGTEGRFSLEDVVGCGKIIELLPPGEYDMDEEAIAALGVARGAEGKIFEEITKSAHARKLLEIGFAEDVRFAAMLDLLNVVPILRGTSMVPLS